MTPCARTACGERAIHILQSSEEEFHKKLCDERKQREPLYTKYLDRYFIILEREFLHDDRNFCVFLPRYIANWYHARYDP